MVDDDRIVMPISFHLRPWLLLITVLLASSGFALGQWQTRRAQEKEVWADQIRQRAQLPAQVLTGATPAGQVATFSKLQLRGRFIADWPLYLDNRPLHGKAGMYVLMPFSIEGSRQHVLVARGWQARDPQERTRLPKLPTPSGSVMLEGIARDQLDRVMQLGPAEVLRPGGMIQNLELEKLAKVSGLQFYPFIVEQTSEADDGLLRDWPLPSTGADKHRAYAFQWYALTVVAVLFFVVTGFRRGKER